MPQSRLTVSFKETLEGLAAIKPVVGELTIMASATGMRLNGRVQTLLKLSCDRCLNPFFQSLTVDIDEKFVSSDLKEGTKGQEIRELSARDFVEMLPDDGLLDISDVVYQAVTLATPTHCICSDQCPGPPISPAGSDSGSLISSKKTSLEDNQVDPRWKNLKSLFPKEET